jgi:hypothetical protein
MKSNSTNAPYVLILHTVNGPAMFNLSIYGRPTNVKCEFARFPDERSANEEIAMITSCLKEGREFKNRHYDRNDIERVWKTFTVKAHAWW